MSFNYSTYNITSPYPVVEVHSEFILIMLIVIAFLQLLSIVIDLYFLQFSRSEE